FGVVRWRFCADSHSSSAVISVPKADHIFSNVARKKLCTALHDERCRGVPQRLPNHRPVRTMRAPCTSVKTTPASRPKCRTSFRRTSKSKGCRTVLLCKCNERPGGGKTKPLQRRRHAALDNVSADSLMKHIFKTPTLCDNINNERELGSESTTSSFFLLSLP
ncbi:hypothetical protein DQ04_22601000, partial [Trypanosoma grayi]|uniref:hypothetical protein n=1 Tax=Trypanosoma grayi TaxID=71804 RepID=UPI0004F3FB1E